MAPRFKRKRQSSQTSSATTTSVRGGFQRGRFKQPSLPTQRSCQREQSEFSQAPPDPQRQTPQHAAPSPVQGRQAANSDGSNEDQELIVMAIDRQQKGAIGCAYYVARDEKLSCLQDVANGSMDAVATLKMDIRPTILLLSSRIDPEDSELDPTWRLRGGSLVGEVGDEPPLPYQVDIRPSQEFGYEAAKTKLVNLESIVASGESPSFLVPGDASTYEDEQDHENLGSTNRQGKLLRLSSCIDFESRIGVGCMGAILTYLQRRRAADYLPEDPDAQWAFRVRTLDMFSLRDTMFINPDTLLSLQIIQPEFHPNAFNQGPGSTGSKESLSLYGLFHHYARTPQGRVRLRQIFLRPSLKFEEINARLDFVTVFVRPDNMIPLQKLSKSMARIKNIRTVMTHLHKGINGGNQKFGGFKSGVWATLLEFAYHTIDIRDTLREVLGGEALPLLAKAMDILDTRLLQSVGRSVHDVVDLDSSIDQNRTVVKRGVNERLDETKNIYDGMGDLLSRTAANIARTLPEHIANKLNVIYIPQLGYYITMPMDPDTGRPLFEGDPDDIESGGLWEQVFTTENQVYFKDARMREMDERLGDLWNMICDLEIEISYDLAQRVLQHEEVLVAVSDLCGELDSMFALALGAHQYKLVRPRMTEANIIDIKSCRHLLQEMTVASYVTNNAYLVGGNDNNPPPIPSTPATPSSSSEPTSPSMLLLTGPNYSGKSVYLKSVAQTLYLSHLGSFVPCSSATIGLTDALLTRIRTCETVSRPHSAFMIDLQQVAYILKMATSRSLVVIDEFGKGTDAADGAGLAAGVFGHLLGEGRGVRPKVLAATHFHEIFEMGYLDPRRGLGLMLAHMEVRVDCRNNHVSTGSTEDDISTTTTTDGGTATEVTYLYNLRPGRSSESFGTQCAAMNGVPGPVVERARQLTLLAAKGEDLVRVCTGVGSREEEEDLVRAEGVARRFLMWDLDGDGDGGELRRVLREVLGEEDEEGEDREGDDEMVTETESVLRTGPGSGS